MSLVFQLCHVLIMLLAQACLPSAKSGWNNVAFPTHEKSIKFVAGFQLQVVHLVIYDPSLYLFMLNLPWINVFLISLAVLLVGWRHLNPPS